MKISEELWGCHNILIIELDCKKLDGGKIERIPGSKSIASVLTRKGIIDGAINTEDFGKKIPGVTISGFLMHDFKSLKEIHGEKKFDAAKRLGTTKSLETHRDILIRVFIRKKIAWIDESISGWFAHKKKVLAMLSKESAVSKAIENMRAQDFVSTAENFPYQLVELRVVDGKRVIQHGFNPRFRRAEIDTSIIMVAGYDSLPLSSASKTWWKE